MIASLMPVIHEFVCLNLFFTAKQTVSFVSLGPNAITISGMLERAVAQEEGEVEQISNDFVSSQLGFGQKLSPEQEAMARMMFGGGDGGDGDGDEEDEEEMADLLELDEVLLEEALEFDENGREGLNDEAAEDSKPEPEKKTKKKKKKNKKAKKSDNDEEDEKERPSKSRRVERDPLQCVSESARRKLVASLTAGWAPPLLEGATPHARFWTSDGQGAGVAVRPGAALRLSSLRVLRAGRADGGRAEEVLARGGVELRTGLGLLPASLEAALQGLRRGQARLVWMPRAVLAGTKERQQLAEQLLLPEGALPETDCDVFFELRLV